MIALFEHKRLTVTKELGKGTYGKVYQATKVDTGELVAMMTAQRAYQANAQTIKTQDQIMSTLVNLR